MLPNAQRSMYCSHIKDDARRAWKNVTVSKSVVVPYTCIIPVFYHSEKNIYIHICIPVVISNALNRKALQYAVIQYCPAVSAMSADVLSLASFLERERERGIFIFKRYKIYIIIAEVCLPASIIDYP